MTSANKVAISVMLWLSATAQPYRCDLRGGW
jgi:hypothetical protein